MPLYYNWAFYQSKQPELLNSYEVPVISPLSKDTGASFSNMLQTIPTTTVVKKCGIES
jgi:hypothetical protein